MKSTIFAMATFVLYGVNIFFFGRVLCARKNVDVAPIKSLLFAPVERVRGVLVRLANVVEFFARKVFLYNVCKPGRGASGNGEKDEKVSHSPDYCISVGACQLGIGMTF